MTEARVWPDLLRREPFGALYFSRRTGRFSPLPPAEAELLLGAQDASVIDGYARQPAPALDERAFSLLVARWRSLGFLDEALRCAAEVVDRGVEGTALGGPLVSHLQLTRACDLRCAHCYLQGAPRAQAREGSAEEWDRLFAQLRALGSPVVRLAGGEPLARPDIFEILESACAHQLDVKLCTNGVSIDPARARRLAALPIRLFSVSLDGADAATHEALRGEGSFARACAGVRALVEQGARVLLRVTVTRASAASAYGFARLGTALGVAMVGFKPYRLTGSIEANGAMELSPAEWRQLCATLLDRWPEGQPRLLLSGGIPSPPLRPSPHRRGLSCPGGTESLTVLPDLRVAACGAHADQTMWDLRAHDLAECWGQAPNLLAWRSLQPEEPCSSCAALERCSGGCRKRAAIVTGRLTGHDAWSCEMYKAERGDEEG